MSGIGKSLEGFVVRVLGDSRDSVYHLVEMDQCACLMAEISD